MTANDKNSLLSRDNLMQKIQMQLSLKEKAFILFLCVFFKSTSKFEHFQKKMTLIIYDISKLPTPKSWFDQCLTSPVGDHHSTGYMVNGPKHQFNLKASILTIFRGHCESSWAGKNHS